jgi:tetratricopeptide (TPR) repeat protein
VWALGAILYEVLTGRPPFRADSTVETLLMVRTEEPLAPGRLRPGLPRDLETICLKCLQKEPAQRYAGADELANDLGRFLAGEPVRARPASRWERALKWARRRPALAALLVTSATALLAGVTGVLLYNAWLREAYGAAEASADAARTAQRAAEEQQRQTLRERDRANANLLAAADAVDHWLMKMGYLTLRDTPQMEPVRQELLAEALQFYRGFLAQQSTDPQMRLRLARGHWAVGDISSTLGRHAEAEGAYRQALALFQGLASQFPGRPAYERSHASVHVNLAAVCHRTARLAEAERHYREGLRRLDRLARAFPGEPAYRHDAARVLGDLGMLLKKRGRPRDAEQLLREAVRASADLARAFPREPDYRRALAQNQHKFASVLLSQGLRSEAERAYAQARSLLEQLVVEAPEVAEHRVSLALSFYQHGLNLVRTGWQPAGAEQALRRAVELDRRLATDFPQAPDHRARLAQTHMILGVVQGAERRFAEAEQSYLRSLEILEEVTRRHAAVPKYQDLLAQCALQYGTLLKQRKRPQEAEQQFHRAEGLCAALARQFPGNPEYRLALVEAGNNLGKLLADDAGQRARAEEILRTVVRLATQLAEEFPDVPDYRLQLAQGHQNLGKVLYRPDRPGPTEQAFRQALDLHEQLVRESPDVPFYRHSLVKNYANLGQLCGSRRFAEALAAFHTAIAHQEKQVLDRPTFVDDRSLLAKLWGEVGALCRATKRFVPAEAAQRRALDLRRRLAAERPESADLRSALACTLSDLAIVLGHVGKGQQVCRLLEEAIELHRDIVQTAPTPARRQHLRDHHTLLALCLLGLGRHAEAARVTEQLLVVTPHGRRQENPSAAAFLGRCAGLAARDQGLPEEQRQALARAYGDRAVALLREAVRDGFTDAAVLRTAPAFAPLREREDFARLLRELEQKGEEAK